MPDTVLFAPVGAKPCPLETSQNLRVNVSVYFHKKNNTVATLVRHMYAPKFGFITPEHVWSIFYKIGNLWQQMEKSISCTAQQSLGIRVFQINAKKNHTEFPYG